MTFIMSGDKMSRLGKFLSAIVVNKQALGLIHCDSPKSSGSLSDRLRRAIQQSNSRIEYFINSNSAATMIKDVSSSVRPGHGNYLMTIYLGTPPVKILAVVNTGSDLICTQGSPPLFDPSRSSTYKEISCNSSLAAEMLTVMTSTTFGHVNLTDITFGCSQDNKENFHDYRAPDLKFGVDGAEMLLGLSWGSIAQQNIKIGYDFDDMIMTFQPTDCAHDQ